MSYFRNVKPQLDNLLEMFSRNERWLITINADPDAMGSAMALKRILSHRVADVDIARVNEITRPDNLAMVRLLRIPMVKLTPQVTAQYDKFAIVDSQPHHHPLFSELDYSIVIDHHPLNDDFPVTAEYKEILPGYGSNSTILTEYLYQLKIRPGKLLATALMYGIKTDTNDFERNFNEIDIRAFKYLSKYANHPLLSRIARSEMHYDWLDYFSRAITGIHKVGSGQYAFVGVVDNPDALVVIADFFMRVHEMRWVAVCGVYQDKAIVIFRGDGVNRDLGRFAYCQFSDIGSAGGHKALARAEIPIEELCGKDVEMFIFKRLVSPTRSRLVKCAKPAEDDIETMCE
ncbi:DHH family phosphoesterase [Halodesulfovibrio aestuarii]|uniref:Bifunctional oligoribonuclease/PAP phosphatase NrnA n=2 Tax=Halodesulfovibrio aestuarii TaxID=126333 RepID=A0A8G2CAX2_9BACT|nr:DHH family phosphoesterase [Halodesulfovibrio aestuarii]SHJ41311.1 DHH family protein [Halodesulfovibrio aestuarii]